MSLKGLKNIQNYKYYISVLIYCLRRALKVIIYMDHIYDHYITRNITICWRE